MSNRATRSARRPDRLDPMGTLPMFDTTTTPEGRVVAAGRFRCGLCNTMGVDEPGELCPVCAAHVLTENCRYTRTPADDSATAKPKARKAAARKPRKSTASKTTTTRKATAARAVSEGVG